MPFRSVWPVVLFFAAFAFVAAWEHCRPRTIRRCSMARRWEVHSLLLIAGNLGAALLLPVSAVLASQYASGLPFALFNLIRLPAVGEVALSILLLDLSRWVQHYLHHTWAVLWRFHKVHHSDADFDATTGFRFHPVETLWTHASYLAVVVCLAPPLFAVLAIELATVVQGFFAHANATLPTAVESRLRKVIVTPEMHRIHHSIEIAEQRCNLGNIFPWWDQLFATYAAPQGSPSTNVAEEQGGGFRFGLAEVEPERSHTLRHVLLFPFRSNS